MDLCRPTWRNWLAEQDAASVRLGSLACKGLPAVSRKKILLYVTFIDQICLAKEDRILSSFFFWCVFMGRYEESKLLQDRRKKSLANIQRYWPHGLHTDENHDLRIDRNLNFGRVAGCPCFRQQWDFAIDKSLTQLTSLSDFRRNKGPTGHPTFNALNDSEWLDKLENHFSGNVRLKEMKQPIILLYFYLLYN